jgi:hypothetical protein
VELQTTLTSVALAAGMTIRGFMTLDNNSSAILRTVPIQIALRLDCADR